MAGNGNFQSKRLRSEHEEDPDTENSVSRSITKLIDIVSDADESLMENHGLEKSKLRKIRDFLLGSYDALTKSLSEAQENLIQAQNKIVSKTEENQNLSGEIFELKVQAMNIKSTPSPKASFSQIVRDQQSEKAYGQTDTNQFEKPTSMKTIPDLLGKPSRFSLNLTVKGNVPNVTIETIGSMLEKKNIIPIQIDEIRDGKEFQVILNSSKERDEAMNIFCIDEHGIFTPKIKTGLDFWKVKIGNVPYKEDPDETLRKLKETLKLKPTDGCELLYKTISDEEKDKGMAILLVEPKVRLIMKLHNDLINVVEYKYCQNVVADDEKDMQCSNCLQIGHTKKYCTKDPQTVCYNCGVNGHRCSTRKGKKSCTVKPKCINCKEHHHAYSLDCKFVQQGIARVRERRGPLPDLESVRDYFPEDSHLFAHLPAQHSNSEEKNDAMSDDSSL